MTEFKATENNEIQSSDRDSFDTEPEHNVSTQELIENK